MGTRLAPGLGLGLFGGLQLAVSTLPWHEFILPFNFSFMALGAVLGRSFFGGNHGAALAAGGLCNGNC